MFLGPADRSAGTDEASMTLSKRESWEQYHQRMLDETARFIEWGLKHPDMVIEIPSKPAGDGGFPPGVGEWFWGTVLTSRPDGKTRRWRDFFLRCRKGRFLRHR